MSQCQKCKKKVAKKDKFCKHCGVNLKTINKVNWFWITILIMVIIFMVSLFLLFPKIWFNYSITIPIVKSLNISEEVGKITCYSDKHKSLLAYDFLKCDLSLVKFINL